MLLAIINFFPSLAWTNVIKTESGFFQPLNLTFIRFGVQFP